MLAQGITRIRGAGRTLAQVTMRIRGVSQNPGGSAPPRAAWQRHGRARPARVTRRLCTSCDLQGPEPSSGDARGQQQAFDPAMKLWRFCCRHAPTRCHRMAWPAPASSWRGCGGVDGQGAVARAPRTTGSALDHVVDLPYAICKQRAHMLACVGQWQALWAGDGCGLLATSSAGRSHRAARAHRTFAA